MQNADSGRKWKRYTARLNSHALASILEQVQMVCFLPVYITLCSCVYDAMIFLKFESKEGIVEDSTWNEPYRRHVSVLMGQKCIPIERLLLQPTRHPTFLSWTCGKILCTWVFTESNRRSPPLFDPFLLCIHLNSWGSPFPKCLCHRWSVFVLR